MKLSTLIEAVGPRAVHGPREADITAVTYRAEAARPGALHACVPGFVADGHDFAGVAVANGAAALIVERVLDGRRAPARGRLVAAGDGGCGCRVLRQPERASCDVAGVTGTNGKTTTVYLVHAILEAAEGSAGMLGTIESRVGGVVEPVARTTPESVDLQATLRRMVAAGDRACAMEVSSHALELERVAGVRFAAAGFTNLTQDHLDFHPDMEHYFAAKARLFQRGARARSTSTTRTGAGWPGRRAGRCSRTGARRRRTCARFAVEIGPGGTIGLIVSTPRGPVPLDVRLRGGFNVSNVLCAVALAELLDLPHAAVRAGIAAVHGRARTVRARRRGPAVHGAGRLRPHAGRARKRASLGPRDHRRALDLRVRLRRRPRPRQAPADGPRRQAPRRHRNRHLRQPAQRGSRGDHRRDHGRGADGHRARPPGGDRARRLHWPARATWS